MSGVFGRVAGSAPTDAPGGKADAGEVRYRTETARSAAAPPRGNGCKLAILGRRLRRNDAGNGPGGPADRRRRRVQRLAGRGQKVPEGLHGLGKKAAAPD